MAVSLRVKMESRSPTRLRTGTRSASRPTRRITTSPAWRYTDIESVSSIGLRLLLSCGRGREGLRITHDLTGGRARNPVCYNRRRFVGKFFRSEEHTSELQSRF